MPNCLFAVIKLSKEKESESIKERSLYFRVKTNISKRKIKKKRFSLAIRENDFDKKVNQTRPSFA